MAKRFLTKVPRPFNEERIVIQQMMLRTLVSTCKRIKLNPYITLYKKINSKQVKDLNVRARTIKNLEYVWKHKH